MNTYSGRVRYEAYREVLDEYGFSPMEEWVLKGEFIKKTAAQEVLKLVNHGKLPTALVCCNDDMALSAIEVLPEQQAQHTGRYFNYRF